MEVQARLLRRRLGRHAELRSRPNSGSAQKSTARRSSANTTRPPCCCPDTPPRSTVHGNILDPARHQEEIERHVRQGRSHHARHHRERAEERPLRDGRRRGPHLAVARHPRAARRISDDLQRARADGRRPVRLLHPRDRRTSSKTTSTKATFSSGTIPTLAKARSRTTTTGA